MNETKSVNEYLETIKDEQTLEDSKVLLDLMEQISGVKPKLWNQGTIGFDTYHYKYESGREGDGHVLGFYPRKNKITVYLMDGTERYSDQLAKLGSHTKTGYCIYIKKLSDIKLSLLKEILQKSYKNIKSQDGNITEILWKSGK